MTTTDPAVEAAYRALQDALAKAAPPPKDRQRDEDAATEFDRLARRDHRTHPTKGPKR